MIGRKKQAILNTMKQYFTMEDIQKTFSLLRPYIMRHRIAYMVLLFLLFIDIFLTLTFAWLFGNILDAAVRSDFQRIKWLVPLACILTFMSITSSFFDTYFESVATNGVKRDLKKQLFKHILLLPAKDVSNLRSGELLSHFTNDIHNINGVIGRSLINLIRLPLIYITVFIYLVYINWKLALLSILVAPLAALSGVVFGLLLRRNSRLIHSLLGTMNNLLNETFLGFSVIRSFTMEKLLYEKFTKQNQQLYSLELDNTKLGGWFYAGGQAVSSFTFLISLCLGAYFVSDGVMSVGSLLTFINLVNHLVYPLTGLAGQWAGFQRSITAVERLLKILELPTESTDVATYSPAKPVVKSIQFQNITFSYDEQQKILNHFNLQIHAGKVTAIVGLSGAGKTTLFNLLQGFYKPQSGCILIDDIAIENLSPSELRSSIAHVPQETFLFGGTIRENLLLARPGTTITEEEMIDSAKAANINEFILSLPNGYDTEIGERGIKLSGGQKQRIAIARAILKNAPILLLDEATSALDSKTEQQVQTALDRLMMNRTTLVIAHRLSTIQNADFIIVMDEGKIVQTGCHEELVVKDGLYRNLYHMQVSQQSKENNAITLNA
ncbi:Putative multidrug export ATP-binding/permease protein [Bacillus rhizoplanae]|uniref:Multidrug export ATP-binding/permease protein n=1 Tax=Bacillus rhizoplanae TaxID=2880966 RepID=A0ABM8YCE0_9BACI|nr:ABC transporter ATP-binding protein [Bacillus rhizoplanae]CAG9613440.1 Putative multidrug export ATP-binding/permease protein [Bacillus rhizoplanae]